MKNILVFLLCFAVGFTNAQRKPKIKGNKSIVEVSEELTPYHKLQLDDDLEIRLERSTERGYTVTADDNLVDVLKFEVSDSTLFISAFYKITGKKELDIVVRYNQLHGIIINDGKITAEEIISTDDMDLEINGFAQADLRLSNEITTLTMDDNSKAQLNIESDSLSIVMRGKSEADIYAVSGSQMIDMESNSLINLEGMTDLLHSKISGSSKLRAQSLTSENVELNIRDTSSARLTANQYLNLSMSGSAKLYLFGEPQIELREFLDNSELYKRIQ